jgi:hypothetical protein
MGRIRIVGLRFNQQADNHRVKGGLEPKIHIIQGISEKRGTSLRREM